MSDDFAQHEAGPAEEPSASAGPRSAALAIPRPNEVADATSICDQIEVALPHVDDIEVVYDAKAKLAAIDAYVSQKSKDGRARIAATMRRLEARIGELLGEAQRGNPTGANQHSGGISGTTEIPDLPLSKDERREFRQMAEHKEIVEEVIASSTDEQPASRRKVLQVIKATEAERKKEQAMAAGDKVEQVRTLAKLGLTVEQIASDLGHSASYVYALARQGNITIRGVEKSSAAVAARADRVRDLAAQGATSHQIANELGMTYAGVKGMCERLCIDVPADNIVGRQRNFDSTRIVAATVDAVNGIGTLFDRIDYSALDPEDIEGWLPVLNDSIRSLTTLRNRLKEVSQP